MGTPGTIGSDDSGQKTKLESVDHMEFVKERNEQFRVCQNNGKKAHSLICNHCNKAMQIQLENDSEFEEEVKGDPFKIMEMTKLKMCDPSKVKCHV